MRAVNWGYEGALSAGRVAGGVVHTLIVTGQSPAMPVSAACSPENQTTAAKKWPAVASLQIKPAKRRITHSMRAWESAERTACVRHTFPSAAVVLHLGFAQNGNGGSENHHFAHLY